MVLLGCCCLGGVVYVHTSLRPALAPLRITDERIEVMSHCYSNVKYLSNVYNSETL